MKTDISFKKDDVQLRAVEPGDIDKLFEWENDPEIWKAGNTLEPYSKFTLEQFIQNAGLDIFQTKQVRWMIDLHKKTGIKTVGTIDLFNFDPLHRRAGVGLLIGDKKERRRGIATKALAILLDYSFQILQLHQIYCNISKQNAVSIRFFVKNGFAITGEKKDWYSNSGKWENELFLQMMAPPATGTS